MNREEAIKIFQLMKKILSIPNSDAARTIEAIDMAIEALSAPQTDYISRADAIEAVALEWLSEASAESPYVNDYDIDKYIELAEDFFKDIPSADACDGRGDDE